MYSDTEKLDMEIIELDSFHLQNEQAVVVETKDTDTMFKLQNMTEKIMANKVLKSTVNQPNQECSCLIYEGEPIQDNMPALSRFSKLSAKRKTGKKKVNKLPITEVVDPDSKMVCTTVTNANLA